MSKLWEICTFPSEIARQFAVSQTELSEIELPGVRGKDNLCLTSSKYTERLTEHDRGVSHRVTSSHNHGLVQNLFSKI